MSALQPSHFLSLPRPDSSTSLPDGAVDTTTLAAHDFDVDTRTGFMPPEPPLERLPPNWGPWELILDDARSRMLQLGNKHDLTEHERLDSEMWRGAVRELPILPTSDLKESERMLRRAHHVLVWVMHFYVHSLPPDAPIIIPASISIPLLQVSHNLALPPVLTYSDTTLYNWAYTDSQTPTSTPSSDASADTELDTDLPYLDPKPARIPTTSTVRCQTLFTSTHDEAVFYLTSTRIELHGATVLELMRASMDEAFVGDALALRRIASYLARFALVVDELTALLLAVQDGCRPEVFYHKIRPWFNGRDARPGGKPWVFEGAEREGLEIGEELSGSSAGQSALVHAMDIFLGVENYSHQHASRTKSTSPSSSSSSTKDTTTAAPPTFLTRMQSYMPRYHRAFLTHLSQNPRPLRALIARETTHGANADLLDGYNAAVRALRAFRDAHLRIVALYIVGPARRVDAGARDAPRSGGADAGRSDWVRDAKGKGVEVEERYKGTGGTDLMPFLKSVRDRTAGTELRDES